VYFSTDGTAFNAEAVVANVDKGEERALPPTANMLRAVESVEVVGEYQVRFNLANPAPLYCLTYNALLA
jgi:ABC-type transport system substrate-binding protein